MFYTKRFITAITVFAFVSVSLMSQNYQVDNANSQVKWTGEKILGKHYGTINIKVGSLMMKNNKMTGVFDIDMNTIVSEDLKGDKASFDKLIGHLKSDDFFSVAKNPTATFNLRKADKYNPRKGENFNYMLTGDLTIKGITNEIRFPAKIELNDKNLIANADFTIDRTKWNVRYGSGSFFDNLGDKAIYDDIKFELLIKAKAN